MTLPLEDELEVLADDLARARRSRESLARSPFEGRFTGDAIDYQDRLSGWDRRIERLEREFTEAKAALEEVGA